MLFLEEMLTLHNVIIYLSEMSIFSSSMMSHISLSSLLPLTLVSL